MPDIKKKLEAIKNAEAKLAIRKAMLVENGLKSKSPSDILTAQNFLQNIEQRKQSASKSYFVDPLDFNRNMGYKDKPHSLSYNTLKGMSKTPVINAIIKTRKNQIADFAEPQADRYSTGFVIKRKVSLGESEYQNTPEDWRNIEYIQNFIMNCGSGDNWDADDFETFVRKIVEDSLIYDQMTFEVVRNESGELQEFFATDASTFRIADSFDDDEYEEEGTGEREELKGYYPNYVQIFQGSVVADFYPWELCFGVRNPSTSIYNVGYGVSELEELISTVTSILWAEDYNKRFFSQGTAPKGILKVKGAVNNKQLEAFRQEWLSTLTGVQQAWKTPVVDGDKVEWVDLHKNNREMEYESWLNYLVKISCSVFSIDPNEIGFNVGNSGNSINNFESNNESKLKHSKDKGLYPLLKFIQRKINKYIVSQIDDRYEFQFVGLNGQTIQDELDIETKRLTNFQTLNETRKKYNMEPIEGGDIILNPTFVQQQAMNQMNQEGVNPFLSDEEAEEELNPFLNGVDMEDMDEDDNPFLKAFKNNLKK